jgi:hypothetical protein
MRSSDESATDAFQVAGTIRPTQPRCTGGGFDSCFGSPRNEKRRCGLSLPERVEIPLATYRE